MQRRAPAAARCRAAATGAATVPAVMLVVAGLVVLAACSLPSPGTATPAPASRGGFVPSQQPGGPSNKQSGAVLVNAVDASCTAPPSQDAAGAPTVFEPVLVLDGDPATAWRCPGDGRNQRISLDFGRPVRITAIAIIPGYAKTDPRDGTDRYRQNRRLTEVLYALDGQAGLSHTLDPSPERRAPQVLDAGGVVSRSLTINLISSAPGEPTNAQPASDNVAISELVVLGSPA